jgi:pimeloyl-ACP methyl ester carboxylesterase
MSGQPVHAAIVPFTADIPDADIDDLMLRLRLTRWSDEETVDGWEQGVPLVAAKALVDYWLTTYDWRRFESRLNAYPQFKTTIDGLGIHFIHVRSRHAAALPVILTHGWPGSVVEFMKVIDPLVDPIAYGGRAEDAFDVVIPSLPGFAFSDKPTDIGWETARTARAWGVLMARLGYTRWVAQGGDWGSGVTHLLAHINPPGLVAAHVNFPLVFPEILPSDMTDEEKRAVAGASRFGTEEAGFNHVQSTRPQTIGYALTDSPVGLAMWIYEKFFAWTDNSGKPEDALTRDEMLDAISLYWFTRSGASAARYYWENSRAGLSGLTAGHIDLPMAGTVYPAEVYLPPRAWAEKVWPRLLHWGTVDKGGHFGAFEQPSIFVDELRLAFATLRLRADI